MEVAAVEVLVPLPYFAFVNSKINEATIKKLAYEDHVLLFFLLAFSFDLSVP